MAVEDIPPSHLECFPFFASSTCRSYRDRPEGIRFGRAIEIAFQDHKKMVLRNARYWGHIPHRKTYMRESHFILPIPHGVASICQEGHGQGDHLLRGNFLSDRPLRRSFLRDDFLRGNKSLMSILLNTLLVYPDHPLRLRSDLGAGVRSAIQGICEVPRDRTREPPAESSVCEGTRSDRRRRESGELHLDASLAELGRPIRQLFVAAERRSLFLGIAVWANVSSR